MRSISLTPMDACIGSWNRYMGLMRTARRCRDPEVQRALIFNAYVWLVRYFEAVELETFRQEREAGRRIETIAPPSRAKLGR
jgi:hypothetical protein